LPSARAQVSAAEVVNAAREAVGGARLAAIETLSLSGAAANGSVESDVTLSFQLPDKFLREQTVLLVPGSGGRGVGAIANAAAAMGIVSPTVVDCLEGDEQWSDLRLGPEASSDIASMPGARNQLEARQKDFGHTFTRYLLALLLADRPNYRLEFSYLGETESLAGGMVDVLEGKGPDDFVLRWFLDKQTHRPEMIAYQTGNNLTQLWMDKYKEEGGVLLPHRLSWLQNGNQQERLEIKKVRINPKFPAGKFVKRNP